MAEGDAPIWRDLHSICESDYRHSHVSADILTIHLFDKI